MQCDVERASGNRDLKIDWLRGLAMTCVIVNHSKLSSPLSWFSYERLWVVTAAEVFVVLSGTVLGMVYRRRLDRDGWRGVLVALGRRAVFLYAMFVGVTLSIVALALSGVDVHTLAPSSAAWFIAPQAMNASAWRDVLLMRVGPWPFEIIGLYVWLVAAAAPCLLILRFAGWRWLTATSWALYVWYQLHPHAVTSAGFESAFPLLAWQLLFVHGLMCGYHRDRIAATVYRLRSWVPTIAVLVTIAFGVFAFCNPWTDGPEWLHLRLLSEERFSDLYNRYFVLGGLGAGRLLNLTIGLALAYVALGRCWKRVSAFHTLFITLGQQSLGAFVLHVYAVLMLSYLPLAGNAFANMFVQLAIVVGIAALLRGRKRLRGVISSAAESYSERSSAQTFSPRQASLAAANPR